MQSAAHMRTYKHRHTLKLSPIWCYSSLNPGVGGAGVLVRPLWRPPCGGVEIHVVGIGFECQGLGGVPFRRVRGRILLVRILLVALWRRQVHSVVVESRPVLWFVVKRLLVLMEGLTCEWAFTFYNKQAHSCNGVLVYITIDMYITIGYAIRDVFEPVQAFLICSEVLQPLSLSHK